MKEHKSSKQIESVRVKIGCTQLLDSAGSLIGVLPGALNSQDAVIQLYRAMLQNRLFDQQAVALQRTGRLGTFASALGQEAVSVSVALAMSDEDVMIPSFREQGGQLVRGVKAEELLGYWGGDERGSAFTQAVNDFPVCIPVGSQFPQAVGVSLAFKMKNEHRVGVVFGGDGSTSKGDFYEAINMAGVWDAPCVFVIVNNQWAISTPRKEQTHALTLAQKAIAGGIQGIQVDGNDAFAVYDAASNAISKAREGKGASLIEALTYRMSDHTTADDASRYRSDSEVEKHKESDPLLRLKRYLEREFDWNEEKDKALQNDVEKSIKDAIQHYLNSEQAAPSDMFDYLFAQLPAELKSQRDSVSTQE